MKNTAFKHSALAGAIALTVSAVGVVTSLDANASSHREAPNISRFLRLIPLTFICLTVMNPGAKITSLP